MKINDKYKVFLKHKAKVEFLEGTTFAGKTTIGVLKFMFKVAESDKKFHILSGLDLGTIEKNIINSELGILDIFGDKVQYLGNGSGGINLPHIKFRDKYIYVLGYDNKARWKKALGGQYGCVYIDEINIADMEFIREVFLRFDYAMGTLNPDNPDLEVYKEYINRSRPLPQYENDMPNELREMLNEEAIPNWTHWYFTFNDNAGITPDKIEQLVNSGSKESKLYKNKILGLRGRATGLIFNLEKRHLLTVEQAKQKKYQLFSLGVDTSYSKNTKDTFAMVYGGLTTDGEWIVLEVREFNNKDLVVALTPSDMPIKINEFLEMCFAKWGFTRSVFIDSADQATILECRKYVRTYGKNYNVYDAYKKTTNIDRINLQTGWMATGKFFIVEETCKPLIREMNVYSWKETKDEPEDGNDHDIQADQYAFLPYKEKIGK